MLPLDEHLRPKATRWIRALRRQTRRVWLAQDDKDTEQLAIELTLAVAAVRVLDLEVFQATHGTRYEQHRNAHAAGQAVNGMTLVRNAEMHLPLVLSPASNPVYGFTYDPHGESANHVFLNAKWEMYDDLPERVREDARTARRCHTGYRTALEGIPVTETLLEALAFFCECDPRLAAVAEQGDLPLPILSGTLAHYHRLDVREPSLREVDARLRDLVAQRSPNGEWREITYVIRSPDGERIERFAGFEEAGPYSSAGARNGVTAWVDYPNVVVQDLERGHPYFLVRNGERLEVSLLDGVPAVDRAALHELDLPHAPETPDRWVIGFWRSLDTFDHAFTRGLHWHHVVRDDELRVPR